MDIFKIHPRIINTANQSGLESILKRTNDSMNVSHNDVYAQAKHSVNVSIEIHQQSLMTFHPNAHCFLFSFRNFKNFSTETSRFKWLYFQNDFFFSRICVIFPHKINRFHQCLMASMNRENVTLKIHSKCKLLQLFKMCRIKFCSEIFDAIINALTKWIF